MFYYHVQDTLNALEALAEYELKRAVIPESNLVAEFTVPGKTDILKLTLEKKENKAEIDLKVTQNIVCITLKYTNRLHNVFHPYIFFCVPEI